MSDSPKIIELGPYNDLLAEKGPQALIEALKLWGTAEAIRERDNPVIMSWARELAGVTAEIYRKDEDPWCGLYAGVVMKRAGFEPPAYLVRARAWLSFGSEVTQPELMDILIFRRTGGGHVGFYVGEDVEALHVLGGNQGDKVSIARLPRAQIIGCRRPLYDSTPRNVRQIYRSPAGGLLINGGLA